MKVIDVSGMDLCNVPLPWNSSPFGHITVGAEDRVFMIPVHAKLQAKSMGWQKGSRVIWNATAKFLDDIEPDLAKMIYPDTRPSQVPHEVKPQQTALTDCFPKGIPVLIRPRWFHDDDQNGAMIRIRLPLRQLSIGDTHYVGTRSERRRGTPQLLCRAPFFQGRMPSRDAPPGTKCGAATEESLWAIQQNDAINVTFVCDGVEIGWDPYVIWFDGTNVYCHTQSEYLLRNGIASGLWGRLAAAWSR